MLGGTHERKQKRKEEEESKKRRQNECAFNRHVYSSYAGCVILYHQLLSADERYRKGQQDAFGYVF